VKTSNLTYQSNVAGSRKHLAHAAVETGEQHVSVDRQCSVYTLQQIEVLPLSFPVRNISCCENELSVVTEAAVNISGLQVGEGQHAYVFSFTFSSLSPRFIVFYLFSVVLPMLCFIRRP
jgi:hypothetical protein